MFFARKPSLNEPQWTLQFEPLETRQVLFAASNVGIVGVIGGGVELSNQYADLVGANASAPNNSDLSPRIQKQGHTYYQRVNRGLRNGTSAAR